jgi:predicted transcriptional regulator
MPVKQHLSVRLDSGLLGRLTEMAASRRMEIVDLISAALDALERNENVDEELSLVHEALERLNEKMVSADKVRGMFQIMEKQLITHDEAERARFERIAGPHAFN